MNAVPVRVMLSEVEAPLLPARSRQGRRFAGTQEGLHSIKIHTPLIFSPKYFNDIRIYLQKGDLCPVPTSIRKAARNGTFSKAGSYE